MKKYYYILLLLIIPMLFSACALDKCDYCGGNIIVSLDKVNDGDNYCEICKTKNIDNSFSETFPIIDIEDLLIDETKAEISVNEMESGIPYALCDGIIVPIEQIKIIERCIKEERLSQIPVLSQNEQIILRLNSGAIKDIEMYSVDISWDFYINPYVRFWHRPDTGVLSAESSTSPYVKELGNMVEIDHIDEIYDFYDMPLYYWQKNKSPVPSYYLYCSDCPCEYTVGYWKGSNYNEISIDVSCLTAELTTECYTCDFSKTYDGYFILNIPNVESGYYYLNGFSCGSYMVYIE